MTTEQAEAAKADADRLFDDGRIDDAIAAYRQLLAAMPAYARAWNNFGLCLRLAGRPDEAEEAFRAALSHSPTLVPAWINLASAQEEARRYDEALTSLDRALALDPGSRDALNNAGQLLASLGRYAEAEQRFRVAIDRYPGEAAPHLNLGLALTRTGRISEALAVLERALEIEPASTVVADALLMATNYADHLSPETAFARHTELARRVWPAAPASVSSSVRPDGRLKVGYVSADFGYHVVSFFLEPVIAGHDRSRIEVYCYFNGLQEDAQCERLKETGVVWRHIGRMNDDEACRMIRADGLDLAVDLAGHTGGNRLGLFARRIAPVQVTWLGYPNTTGVAAMDYRLTDAWADPPGRADTLHTERLWRLPAGFLVYRPRPEAPPVAPPPCLRNGFVTFGSFNNFAKVSPTALRLWARLLSEVPDARLLIKAKGLSEIAFAEFVRTGFAAAGGDVSRLRLEDQVPQFESHLAHYAEIDIALDSTPYCGTTTTCEALWMGVPVVTLAGVVHAARVGASLLERVGHPEWIANSESDYIRKAVQLVMDQTRLSLLRGQLRTSMAESSLTDEFAFVRSLEVAFMAMMQGEPSIVGPHNPSSMAKKQC